MVRPTWEPKINLGNLLTILGLLGGLGLFWLDAGTKTAKLEVKQDAQEARVDRFEREIINRLDRIERKLDRGGR